LSAGTYELSAAARVDLLQIWNYLAENASIDVADKVVRDIETGIRKLVRMPKLGHARTDLTDRHVLFYRVHSWLITYRPGTKPLQVARVLHSARDIAGLLAGGA
jgi:plasmid stabilization system protein ParE